MGGIRLKKKQQTRTTIKKQQATSSQAASAFSLRSVSQLLYWKSKWSYLS